MDKQSKQTITIALAGNPNSGKTTIFNNLTGSNQHVGNYSGVTVEMREGVFRHDGIEVKVVDLPGTYSLTAYSIEETVARNYIINERPDVVVNVIDGSNLERNLFLTAQLKELGVPMVVALNMADEMKQKGLQVDRKMLGKELGASIVSTIGSRNKGTKRLIREIVECVQNGDEKEPADTPPIHYGQEIDAELEKITSLITDHGGEELQQRVSPHWLAVKLLENDPEVLIYFDDEKVRHEISVQVDHSSKRLQSLFGEDPEMLIAEQRYGYVRGVCRAMVQQTAEARMDFSARVDTILTNRALGLPIFGILMYLTFWLVFTIGETPMGWIEAGIGHLAGVIEFYWPQGKAVHLHSLVVDGIIGGVGGVLVFLPNIVLLFIAISLLEDTGYMARAAFIMDRMMKWVGLHGKSFIPMLTGFGCSVPGIMGTRILDNRRDRLTTMLVLPLMSCGARLPIYMLIIPAFFAADHAAEVLFTIYIIGILLAVGCAKILRATVFKGEPSPFVMELPPYRVPTAKAIVTHVWQRAWLYLKKAGTILLAISIVMWALTSYPQIPAEKLKGLTEHEAQEATLSYSMTGRIGKVMEPVLRPMGFDWKIGTSLVGAFAAKEVFVAQMGIVYSVGEADEESKALRDKLADNYTPLTGFCLALFCLIAAPCMATVAVVRRESGSWGWAMAQFWGLTLIGYILTVIVYQAGSVLRLGVS